MMERNGKGERSNDGWIDGWIDGGKERDDVK